MALDTATATCSVAVVTDNGVVAEITDHGGNSHARKLLVLIKNVLRRACVTVGELDGFGVTVGPGSFTGLRIGISSAQGLATAAGKPAVGISSLEALARQAMGTRLRCAMLDARRKEVYAAVFSPSNNSVLIESPERVASPEALMPDLPAGCIYVGNGAVLYRDVILRHDPTAMFTEDDNANTISAVTVGRLTIEIMNRSGGGTLPLPTPRYIRRSDAERNRNH
ncbi:MAG: tRNA (adenosine(37)-N6)-threonylcarbamoyltransferase complex dimerization subunit type 1 TsaB [Pseudomonadota bacterium]